MSITTSVSLSISLGRTKDKTIKAVNGFLWEIKILIGQNMTGYLCWHIFTRSEMHAILGLLWTSSETTHDTITQFCIVNSEFSAMKAFQPEPSEGGGDLNSAPEPCTQIQLPPGDPRTGTRWCNFQRRTRGPTIPSHWVGSTYPKAEGRFISCLAQTTFSFQSGEGDTFLVPRHGYGDFRS